MTIPADVKGLPPAVTLETPPFVPRMVMTNELKTVVRDVLVQWKARKHFVPLRKYGIRPLDRLLFYGPPGNGKTMACYWIARELSIPIFRVLCNNLRSSYLAETAKNTAEVMNFFGKRTDPCIVLWDEVEAIFVNRKDSGKLGEQEYGAALTVFMQCLDRWESPTLLIMATNLREHLDEALMSRIELQLEFKGPNLEQCGQVIQYWRELLHDHGSDEWGPVIADKFCELPPTSFRELHQIIAFAARDWTAKKFGDPEKK